MPIKFPALGSIARRVSFFCLFLIANATLLPAQSVCPAPAGWVRPASGSFFSDEQEIWLGDATADFLERDYAIVNDPAENAYLEKIGTRLLAALPPTNIRFRFVLIDAGEVNGFSLAGGRVYLTRKLVSNTHSEDEIAAVLGHEIGHIITHQSASEMSNEMRRLLHVNSVTDRADVYNKFRLLMDAERTDKHPHHEEDPDSDENQNSADRVAVYAMSAAGYDPQAYAEFWDRSFFVQGKTGGSFSDFFGLTTPSQKRLRKIRQLVAELPKGCGATATSESAEFHQWQNAVTANQHATATESEAAGEKILPLQSPLRMDLQRLRFSRDGKYLFAQDESSIFVLQSNPLKLLFRFDADDAKPAEWSPDSTRIVFHTPALHVEEWNVAQQKLQAAHEVVVKDDCLQTILSPDGRTLACVTMSDFFDLTGTIPFNILLIDTGSNEVVYQQKDFFHTSSYVIWDWMIRYELGFVDEPFTSAISQDGNYLVIGSGSSKAALDLRTRTPISITGDFHREASGVFAFDSDGIVSENLHPKDSGWYSFPDGKRLGKVPMSVNSLSSVSKGNYLIARGGENNSTLVMNMTTQKMLELPKPRAIDIWDKALSIEAPDGAILSGSYDGINPIQITERQMPPLSPLGTLRVIEFSPDGRYLAVSGRSRGAVWDLKTGSRLYLLRGFTGATFHPDGNLYLDMPKDGKIERCIQGVGLNQNMAILTTGYKMTDSMFMSASHILEWKDEGKEKFSLLVHDPSTGKELWNRAFEKGRPRIISNYTDDNLILVWNASSEGAKAELKNRPELAPQVAALKDKDLGRLIEVVSADKGELLKSAVITSPSINDGSYDVNQVQDTVLLSTPDNRVLLFSAKTGALTQQVFGWVVGVDRKTGLFCVRNRRDEVLVYDLNGKEIAHFQPGTTVRFARFEEDGKKLLLLGSDQKVRIMSLQPALTATN
jgi:WD40 repeat protein